MLNVRRERRIRARQRKRKKWRETGQGSENTELEKTGISTGRINEKKPR